MQLNEEQLAAVQHPLGSPACLIAGAGSGKTRVLTERVRWLINQGTPPRRIAVITFTNKASEELMDRLNLGEASFDTPKVSTIHSLALSAIRKNPTGFGLQEKVTPLDDYDRTQMVRKIVERTVDIKEKGISLGSYVYSLLEKISFHRARGAGFRIDYTDEIHKNALVEHAGYHALDDFDLQIWELFEKEKVCQSVLDFDDMIHLVVRRGESDTPWRESLQKQFNVVLQDEAQDTSPIQWRWVNLLLPPDNYNLMCVGDLGQCQPTGTKVKVTLVAPFGGRKGVWEWRNIEDLKEGDTVPTWHQADQRTYHSSRKIKVASRSYSGKLIKIDTGMFSTECTPNHWNWVRFNKNTKGKYMVYLMYRPDLGFRVGISVFKRWTGDKSRGSYGLTVRFNQEKAEKAWILKVVDSRPEAEAWEEIYSLKYGLPESLFESTACVHKNEELIKLIFYHANPKGGYDCLADFGLLFDQPIMEVRSSGFVGKSWRGFFKTATANIIAGLMDIPIEGRNKSLPIVSCSTRHFDGLVYSLDVEKDHTYVADGLVVGNSIYSFQGARPALLKAFSEEWKGRPTKLYRIATNHRSLPRIVYLANHIQSKMGDEVIPLKMAVFRGDAENKGTIELTRASLPIDIAMIVASEISKDAQRKKGHIAYKDNAILVRSSRQIADIENALVRHRIPYQIRGGKGLLQTEEVRDVLSYLRLVANSKDFTALVRAVSVSKAGVGDVGLEKIRKVAQEKYNGDLIKGASSVEKLSLFVQSLESIQKFKDYPAQALDQIIAHTNYKSYIENKYKKEPDKVKSKLENLARFKELVRGLSEDQKMSTEDLVFQLTLDRAREDDKDGMVVVSTIHSAKGLEWDRVYLFGVVEGLLPHRFSMGSESELQEEKRLLYVACTRARDALTLCVHAMEQNDADSRRVKPSRFLIEAGIISE